MIIKKVVVGRLSTNCYLTGDENNLLIIDPGDEAKRLLQFVEKEGFKVKYIVLTHCHYDHIGAVSEIKEKTGAKLLIGEKEKGNYLSDGVSLRSYFGDEKQAELPDVLLKEGDIIESGEYRFKVIETPGHTSGGICLLCDDALFSGDTIFCESVGRTDLPTGDMAQLLANIRGKLLTLPGKTVVYPGHGEQTTIAYEKENNMFF